MKNNAISVANEFIQLAKNENAILSPLKLMKLVYIAHGFGLALLDEGKSLIDPRFDKVEAWRYGPVIPSVYHTFKQYKNENVGDFGVIMTGLTQEGVPLFENPKLTGEIPQRIIQIVWKRYKEKEACELVDLTHMKGTPWSLCYKENENNEIPDRITKMYYDKVITMIIKENGK